MEIHISLSGRGDLAARIYRQILEAIVDARLRPGERLPPTRELAARLDVSRNTVGLAYERLIAEGFLQGRVGSGTFVCGEVPPRDGLGRRAPAGTDLRPRRIWQSLAVPAPARSAALPYDFRVGVPDVRLFPLTAWRRLVARELRPAAMPWAGYGEPGGHAALRAAIARHVGVSRSVRAGADDVVVTQGAQQALDLIGRVLIEPGSVVAVEEPGYPPARRLFRSLGARVVGVPVDAEGLVVDALPASARLVYVTPSHQFPLGTAMSLARRATLLSWAQRRDGLVIEDDYDSEFRFDGRPLDPLQSLDRGGRVMYVGSFSKSMLPMLRLGFLVAPAALQPALRTAKQLTDWHGDLSAQRALSRFIDDGLLARHIRKASREYAARRQRIVDILRLDFAEWLQLVPSAAGLHVTARLVPESTIDADAVAARARARGVDVSALSHFSGERRAQPGLVIGYGAIPTARIDEGLKRLRAALRGSPAT
ncbi:MAG TPA: PLP-dependent aminotransferase family protein [Vicinamibacterales bacterium]|nr:PLP-dependent aminotransferase family protein [Vicinamibacterales bacterium]